MGITALVAVGAVVGAGAAYAATSSGAKPPQIAQPTVQSDGTPAPVDPTALENARIRDLENQRNNNQQSLRIDMQPQGSSSGSGVFIPS